MNRRHGHATGGKVSREYTSYNNMKARCYNEKYSLFHRYGGRGITVCDKWMRSFINFYNDMGDCPEGMSLDREDNNGNYNPENCRWADVYQQAQNSSITKLNPIAVKTIRWLLINTKKSQRDIAKAYGISQSLIGAVSTKKAWSNV